MHLFNYNLSFQYGGSYVYLIRRILLADIR